MSVKWTDERREKFRRTMAAKRGNGKPTRARRIRPAEAAEFARFMAAAWKLYKGR